MNANTMDVPAAVRLANATIGQWLDALRKGADISGADDRALLLDDLERLQEAMHVITDWCPR